MKTLPSFAMNQLLSSHTESYVGCQISTRISMSASK